MKLTFALFFTANRHDNFTTQARQQRPNLASASKLTKNRSSFLSFNAQRFTNLKQSNGKLLCLRQYEARVQEARKSKQFRLSLIKGLPGAFRRAEIYQPSCAALSILKACRPEKNERQKWQNFSKSYKALPNTTNFTKKKRPRKGIQNRLTITMRKKNRPAHSTCMCTVRKTKFVQQNNELYVSAAQN